MIRCCKEMDQWVVEFKISDQANHCVTYDQIWRIYGIRYVQYDRDADFSSDIQHCPWCGTKLPTILADKWFEVLKEEYGIEDPSCDDRDKVPPEFRTDEWWKKRGL